MKVVMLGEDKTGQEASLYLRYRWTDLTLVSLAKGEEVIGLLEKETPDLLLMDISLPDLQFDRLLTNIRSFSDVPIILLSDGKNGLDTARGLEAGADDCLSKPIDSAELLSRVRALLRRTHAKDYGGQDSKFECGNLLINFDTQEVSVSGHLTHLTPTEYRLLCLLARNRGRILSHQLLLERVWGSKHDDLAHIKKYIHRLRKKLGDDGEAPRLLVSERGIGYRLLAPP